VWIDEQHTNPSGNEIIAREMIRAIRGSHSS
jgi:hypothetical protein